MALLQMSALLCTVLALRVASDDVQITCSPGWTSFDERCFQYFSDQKDWSDAEGHCLSMGGNLASVHSEQEHNFLKQLVKTSDTKQNPAWIGGNDCQQEGVWRWSDGTNWDFTKWNSGEPNNAESENCLSVPDGSERNWNDANCYIQRPFLCVLRA